MSPQTRVGDWFLFEDHTIIRVYVFKDELFLFPAYSTPRIYALEYIGWRFASDHEHFDQHKKSITFKFPFTVGPLTTKRKIAREITEKMMRSMKFRT